MSNPRFYLLRALLCLRLLLLGGVMSVPAWAHPNDVGTGQDRHCVQATSDGLVFTASAACTRVLKENPQVRKELAEAVARAADATSRQSPSGRSMHPLQQLSARSHLADKPVDPYYGAGPR